jgi:Protein of unknown function (DUF3716)
VSSKSHGITPFPEYASQRQKGPILDLNYASVSAIFILYLILLNPLPSFRPFRSSPQHTRQPIKMAEQPEQQPHTPPPEGVSPDEVQGCKSSKPKEAIIPKAKVLPKIATTAPPALKSIAKVALEVTNVLTENASVQNTRAAQPIPESSQKTEQKVMKAREEKATSIKSAPSAPKFFPIVINGAPPSKDTTTLKLLGNLPPLRDVVIRPGKCFTKNPLRMANEEAWVGTERGEIAEKACRECSKGCNPFTTCCVVDGKFPGRYKSATEYPSSQRMVSAETVDLTRMTGLFKGACANCHYNASGSRCSFVQGIFLSLLSPVNFILCHVS